MTEDAIIALYWKRNEDAIVATKEKYGRYCMVVAKNVLGNDADAEEIFSDACLKAWNTIPPEKPSSLKAYLARMTRQLAINRIEKDTARKRGGGEYTLALEELEGFIGTSDDPVEQIALKDAMNAFLRSLPTQSRQIFALRYWHFYSVADIAKHLSISQSKVKMQLLRSRDKLRAHLLKEGFLV